MLRFKSLSLTAIFIVILFSCGNALPELEGIDLEQWKHDRNGCRNKRSMMTEALKKEKAKLQALTEMEIIDLLGRPDANELLKRNQKQYYYFLDPSARCDNHDSTGLKLSIRFNAMGLAKEISIE